jgi:LCP family protein required for cell wall assembly
MSIFLSLIRRKWKWIAGGTAIVLVLGTVGTGLVGYLKVRQVVGEIHHVPVHDLGKRPPVYSTSSMNILVFGSDSRAGLDHHQQVLLHTGVNDGENNTDTIMLLHLSPGRHFVTAMSIPRDTMVPYYQCDPGPGYPGQQANPSAVEPINALVAAGGPSCLWKTVEQQTGIHVDHFIEIGLAGFVNVINDLGGVNVCTPFDVNDPVSGLVLPVGEHHIDGVTALAFWRTREDLGEGSDLQRIQRDQFMSAQVVKGIMQSGLLSNPLRLLSVLGTAAPNLTIDSGMSLTDLLHVGESLHGLTSKNVQFLTAPVVPWPPDPNRVELTQPAASTMFTAIAHDASVPSGTRSVSATPSASTSATSGGPALEATPLAPAQAAHAVPASPASVSSPPATSTPSGTTTPTPSASSPNDIGSLAANNGGISGAAACSADAASFAGPNSPAFSVPTPTPTSTPTTAPSREPAGTPTP